MKIEDLLQMDPLFGFRKPLNSDGTILWSLDQIERAVHHPALYPDENELLVMLARRIRDERDYRMSTSLLSALEIIASKVADTN